MGRPRELEAGIKDRESTTIAERQKLVTIDELHRPLHPRDSAKMCHQFGRSTATCVGWRHFFPRTSHDQGRLSLLLQ